MYSVIIADNEPWILYKLKNVFNWKEYNFSLIAETTSSTELVNLIDEKNPDVVFTDINMPGLTGIDIVKRAREQKSDTVFVLISGYADFSYAQKAIDYGVFSYIVKPVTEEKANNLLESLKDYLDEKSGAFKEIKPDSAKIEAFKKLINYINEHYCERLYLNELSQQFDINMTYCCYLFNKNFDCTFSKYILKCRMDKAAALILKGENSIAEISEILGYDYYHFNKIFKKYYSLTPKQYKILKS